MRPGFDWYDYQMVYDANLDRYYIADTKRDPNEVLSINGFGQSSGDSKSFYLAALDDQGQVLWYHENQRALSWTIGDVTLDDNGDIYFTGKYFDDEDANGIGDSFAGYDFVNTASMNPKSPFLVKLDPSGNLLWGTNATGSSRFPGRSIAISGNEVFLGLGSLDNEWDGIPFATGIDGAGQVPNNIVVRFDKSNGDVLEVIEMPPSTFSQDHIMAIGVDGLDNLVVGGYFGSELLTGHSAGSLNKAGGDADFFIAQWGDGNCSLGSETPVATSEVQLYPQPAEQIVKLKNGGNIENYRIYDLTGKLLQEGKVHEARINISALPTGLYVIRLKDRSQDHYSKRLIVE